MKKILLCSATILLLNSCAQIFNGVVMPDRCKRCEVIDLDTNFIVWEVEGCGSENTRLEEKAKVKAYDLSQSQSNMCNLKVSCIDWKREEED